MFNSKKIRDLTVIGHDARFEGTLQLKGAVHIEGEFEGTLEAEGEVSVGPSGRFMGEMIGDRIAVAGKSEGTLVARGQLHVLKTGSALGDIFYQALQVDAGGVVDGALHAGSPGAGDPELEPAALPSVVADDEPSGVVAKEFPSVPPPSRASQDFASRAVGKR